MKQNSLNFQMFFNQNKILNQNEDQCLWKQKCCIHYTWNNLFLPLQPKICFPYSRKLPLENPLIQKNGKRNKFIASDFLTEWLYNKNPKKKDESFTELFSIPFVKDWLKDHPRPPIPLSLLISEEEASILIQSFWRGYRVRCDSEIQELHQWQKKLREERHINKIVKEFWTKQEAKVGSKSEELDKRTQNPSTSQF
ncbi:IQ domain-containing protein K isoform X6 [Aphelocoma coerulescens]